MNSKTTKSSICTYLRFESHCLYCMSSKSCETGEVEVDDDFDVHPMIFQPNPSLLLYWLGLSSVCFVQASCFR